MPVREALAQIGHALLAGDAFVPSVAQREFRIGAGDLVEFSIAPQLIEEVAREAPGILIKLVPVPEGELGRQMLEAEEIDVILDGQTVKGSGVHNEVAAQISLVTFIWKREKLSCKRFPLDLYLKRRTSSSAWRSAAGPSQNFTVMPIIAALTGYICNLPSGMGPTFAKLFDLSVHEPPLAFSPTPLDVSWHRRSEADQALAWLLRKIRQVVNDLKRPTDRPTRQRMPPTAAPWHASPPTG